MHADFQGLLALRDGQPVDASVLQHVKQCAACSQELTRLASLTSKLRQLTVHEPPVEAWAQIKRRLERRPKRRSNGAPMVALAASVVLAVLVFPMIHQTPVVAPLAGLRAVDPDALDALVRRSQRLESVLQVLPPRPSVERAGTSATIDELQRRIQLLDLQLSAAPPDAGRDDARKLWSARVELMNSLVRVRYAEVAGSGDLSEHTTNLGAI